MAKANIITITRYRSNKKLIKIILYAGIILLFFSFIYILIYPLFKADEEKKPFSFLNIDGYWADSVFNSLTVEEKIHQLLIIKEDVFNIDTSSVLNKPYSGYLFRHDSIKKFREFDQFRSQLSKPLLTSISHIDSIKDFPVMLPPKGIYSIRDDSLIKRYMLNHLEKVLFSGSNMAIFPLATDRYYSEENPDTMILRRKSNYFSYYQSESLKKGIIPVLPVSLRVLSAASPTSTTDTIINDYFCRLINSELPAIIVDTIPETINKNGGLRNFLYKKYGFTGLMIFKKDIVSSEVFFNLLESGINVIVSNSVPASVIQKIVVESTADRKKTKYLNSSCLKVIYLKEWLLGNKEELKDQYYSTLNGTLIKQLYLNLEKSSIIRLRDNSNIIPLSTKANINYTLHLPVGTDFSTFTEHFGYFADYNIIRFSHINNLRPSRTSINIIYLTGIIEEEDLVDFESRYYSSGFDKAQIIFINTDELERLRKLQFLPALVHIHRNTIFTQRIVANFLFGGASCSGIIPWDMLPDILSGEGLNAVSAVRLNYTIPEEAGINSNYLKQIDSIIEEAILNAVFPAAKCLLPLGVM